MTHVSPWTLGGAEAEPVYTHNLILYDKEDVYDCAFYCWNDIIKMGKKNKIVFLFSDLYIRLFSIQLHQVERVINAVLLSDSRGCS